METVNWVQFQIEVDDNDKDSELNGCVRMTCPQTIPIGCFKLPLMMSLDDVIIDDVIPDVASDESDDFDESNEEYYY